MHILVYLEERNGQIRKPSLEAITAAKSLGATKLSAAIVAANASAIVEQAKLLDVSEIFVVDEPKLSNYSSHATNKGLHQIVLQSGAEVIIMGATGRGKDLAPRLTVALDGGYVPDVTQFSLDGSQIVATHPIYAGKANAHIKINTKYQVLSTRPNLWKASKDAPASAPVITNVRVTFEDKDFTEKTISLTLAQGKLDVSEADIIVSGGRGMKGPEHWNLLEDLAGAFGAATGASRAVVDAGWRPHSEQVGQTGKTVSPSLYVAVGISGAVQHLAGMSSSKTIVAINKDANAPIFGLVDYGIVGDIFEILPALTEEIKRIKAH